MKTFIVAMFLGLSINALAQYGGERPNLPPATGPAEVILRAAARNSPGVVLGLFFWFPIWLAREKDRAMPRRVRELMRVLGWIALSCLVGRLLIAAFRTVTEYHRNETAETTSQADPLLEVSQETCDEFFAAVEGQMPINMETLSLLEIAFPLNDAQWAVFKSRPGFEDILKEFGGDEGAARAGLDAIYTQCISRKKQSLTTNHNGESAREWMIRNAEDPTWGTCEMALANAVRTVPEPDKESALDQLGYNFPQTDRGWQLYLEDPNAKQLLEIFDGDEEVLRDHVDRLTMKCLALRKKRKESGL